MTREISKVDGGPEFLAAFEEYLQYYGLRTSLWECAVPTFREQPEVPFGFIRHAVMNDLSAPLDVQQKVANETDKLAVEVAFDPERRRRSTGYHWIILRRWSSALFDP